MPKSKAKPAALPIPPEADERELPSGEHDQLPSGEVEVADIIPIRGKTKKALEQLKPLSRGTFDVKIEPLGEFDSNPKCEYTVHPEKDGSYSVDLRLWRLPFPSYLRELHEAEITIHFDPDEVKKSKSSEQFIKNKLADALSDKLKQYSRKRRMAHNKSLPSGPDKKLSSHFEKIELLNIARKIEGAFS